MNLVKFPRRSYFAAPSPLERLDRLSELLDGPTIYMKRDDLIGPAGGGNKTRKLEFLMADAIAEKADVILTAGAIQSNHCRLTLAAANREGIKCQLVLQEPEPGSYSKDAGGNIFLYGLLKAEQIHLVSADTDVSEKMKEVALALKRQGRRPYIIPVGGSNAIGALGYTACALEILSQTYQAGIDLAAIVTTSGSVGTHAGLLAGVSAMSAGIPVVGISVINQKEAVEKAVLDLAREVFSKLGIARAIDAKSAIAFDEYIGDGYAKYSEKMVKAVRMVAETEAILLDPVYTGKAMSGLIDLICKGHFKKGQNVVFLHTGGVVVLPERREWFKETAE